MPKRELPRMQAQFGDYIRIEKPPTIKEKAKVIADSIIELEKNAEKIQEEWVMERVEDTTEYIVHELGDFMTIAIKFIGEER